MLRLGQINSAAADFACDPLIIAISIETEQRQPEAIFPAGRAVATAGVAAGFGEHRHHIEMKTDRPIGDGIFHHQRHVDGVAARIRL